MRGTLVVLEALTLLLLITVPVGAAPSLQKGAQTSYNLSASISFLQACEALGGSTSDNPIVCPLMVTIPSPLDINGTLDWTVLALNNTSASLIVTRDLTISRDTGDSAP